MLPKLVMVAIRHIFKYIFGCFTVIFQLRSKCVWVNFKLTAVAFLRYLLLHSSSTKMFSRFFVL